MENFKDYFFISYNEQYYNYLRNNKIPIPERGIKTRLIN